MPLDATGRARTLAQFMRNTALSMAGITKADLSAAVNATDQWLDDNQASYNTALPQPFRGAAGLPLKTALLCAVAMRRAGLLRAEEDG